MPSFTVAYNTDTDVVYYRFPEKSVAYQWHHEVTLIKAWAREGVQTAEHMKWSDDEIAISIHTWFSKVQGMSDRYGQSMIPPDIMRAVEANNNVLQRMKRKPPAFASEGETNHPKHAGCKVLVTMRAVDVKLAKMRL